MNQGGGLDIVMSSGVGVPSASNGIVGVGVGVDSGSSVVSRNVDKPQTGNGDNNHGDDLNSLEAEISELQRENARVESQMMRLKSDINAMESQLSTSDREASPLSAHQQRVLPAVTGAAGGAAAVVAASPSGQSPFAAVSSTTVISSSAEHDQAITTTITPSGTLRNSSINASVGYNPNVGMMSHGDPSNGGVTGPPNTNINNYYESLRNNVITLLEHVRLPPPPPPPPGSGSVASSSAGLQSAHGLDNGSLCGGGGQLSACAPSMPEHTAAAAAAAYSTLLPPPPSSAVSVSTAAPMYGHHATVNSSAAPPPPPLHHAYTVHHPGSYPHPHSHPHEHFDSYISKLQSLCVPPDVYALPEDSVRPVYNSVKPSMHQDYSKLMPTPI